MQGYIYILSNPAIPSMVKVGKTTLTPHERAKQLSISTGVPLPYRVEVYYASNNIDHDERFIHHVLACQRVNGGREFFYGTAETVRRHLVGMSGVTWLDGSVVQPAPTPPAPQPPRPVVLPPPPNLKGEARQAWQAQRDAPPLDGPPHTAPPIPDEVLRTLHPVRRIIDRNYRNRHR